MHIGLKSCLVFLALQTIEASVIDFPAHRTLAGLSNEEVERVSKTFERTPGAQPRPSPMNDTSSKLIFDANHPWRPLRKGDVRGPCPGLNTLANHGYIDRSGIATPEEMINAAQIAFNMPNGIAATVAYAAHLVDGNLLTNLLSIGGKTPRTGTDPPPPAIIGGLNTHGVFEGDASLTRGDDFFGDNHNFNETLFQQLVSLTTNGTITVEAMADFRFARILDSKARNPKFDFTSPRFVTAYAEAAFPFAFFTNATTGLLTVDDMRSFFEAGKFPDGYMRRGGDLSQVFGETFGMLFAAHQTVPGKNDGAGNFVVDPTDPGLSGSLCYTYTKHTNTVIALYPNPQRDLRNALRTTLDTFYNVIAGPPCPQLFPYGQ